MYNHVPCINYIRIHACTYTHCDSTLSLHSTNNINLLNCLTCQREHILVKSAKVHVQIQSFCFLYMYNHNFTVCLIVRKDLHTRQSLIDHLCTNCHGLNMSNKFRSIQGRVFTGNQEVIVTQDDSQECTTIHSHTDTGDCIVVLHS